MVIKGLDNGYLFTKDDEYRIFKSAYTEEDILKSNNNVIYINDKKYVFGSGNTTVDVDKIDTDINMVCTLANLALTGNNEYKLVVGLPLIQYKSTKDRLKNTMLSYNENEVVYKGRKLNFSIKDVIVYPQGAGALFSQNTKPQDTIIIDIGSRTINIILFQYDYKNMNIVTYDTIYNGMINLYSDVAEKIKEKYGLTKFDERRAEQVLTGGLKINGECKDISFIKPIIDKYITVILDILKIKYPYLDTQILLCGGGSLLLESVITGVLPNASVIEDSQFANAKGFKKIGEMKWR